MRTLVTILAIVLMAVLSFALAAPVVGSGAWSPPSSALARAALTSSRYDDVGGGCSGGLTPHALALANLIAKRFGRSDIGGYACRANTANAGKLSVHAVGRAIDVMITGSLGDEVANWLLANADSLGIQLIIWRHRLWRSGKSDLKPYGGPNPHTDHIHVEVFNDGLVPGDPASTRVHLEVT